AVIAVLAVLAGGGVAVWHHTGDASAPSASAASNDEPSEPEQQPEPAPEPEPTTSPARTDPWGAFGPGDEVVDVTLRLEDVGYACYNTLDAGMLTPDVPITVNEQNVMIRRCYADPVSVAGGQQAVGLQVAPDGSPNGVRVVVSTL